MKKCVATALYHALIVNAKLRDIVMENIKEHIETHNLKTFSASTLKYAKEFTSLCNQESDIGHDFCQRIGYRVH